MNTAPPQATGGGISAPVVYKTPKTFMDVFSNIATFLNSKIMAMNNSKLFAGFIIIILNISSKFVTIKLSKSMESYLKFTFSRDILIFSMAWMGTRDIYIALLMTILFVICMKYLFNEDSAFCCLPERFTTYHSTLMDTEQITDQQYSEAMVVMEKYRVQHNLQGKPEQNPLSSSLVKEGFEFRKFDTRVKPQSVVNTPSILTPEEDYHPFTE